MLEKASRSAAGPTHSDSGSAASGRGSGAGRRRRNRVPRPGSGAGRAAEVDTATEVDNAASVNTAADVDSAESEEHPEDLPTRPDLAEDVNDPADTPHVTANERVSLRRAAAVGGGLVIAPGWRDRAPTPPRLTRAELATACRRGLERTRDIWRQRPTPAELREFAARRPSAEEVKATARRHRYLIGGLILTLLLATGDAAGSFLVTDMTPVPGVAHRVAVAYPLQLSTPVPSVRRYLDAIDNGERLREQAVVAAASRATLERAKAEAAAAAAGQEQPWINTAPGEPGLGTIPPGAIPPSAGGFVLPAPGTFTSGFGSRWGTFHRGIDIAGPIGTPIYAVADGTVIDAGPAAGFGLWVRIRHNDGSISVYGHMYDFFVSVGERVPAGMQIARMGNRGDSTGPHLHFEIIMDGQHVDPQRWLALHGLSYG